MSRPSFTPLDLTPAQAGWDATIQTNFEGFDALVSGPLPIVEYATAASLPAAASYDRCIVMVNETTIGWRLRISTGSSWLRLLTTSDTPSASVRAGVLQAAAVADLNQTIAGPSTAEVQAISDKMDELLAVLRTSGVMAT